MLTCRVVGGGEKAGGMGDLLPAQNSNHCSLRRPWDRIPSCPVVCLIKPQERVTLGKGVMMAVAGPFPGWWKVCSSQSALSSNLSRRHLQHSLRRLPLSRHSQLKGAGESRTPRQGRTQVLTLGTSSYLCFSSAAPGPSLFLLPQTRPADD